MTLRKLTVDNSVKFIAQSGPTQLIPNERDIKPNTLKNNSLPKKQNKKLSQHIENFLEEYITAE